MGGNKGRAKPVDRRKWPEAYRKQKTWGEPHQWRLERLEFIKLELQTFFTSEKKNLIPGKKLKRIEQVRSQIPRDVCSSLLIEKVEHELDAQEIELYQYLLPPERFSFVTKNFRIVKSRNEWKPNLIKEFLVSLRQEFSTLPDQAKRLKTPLGKSLVAGSKKAKGKSWESSAIARKYILQVYNLFRQFYPTTGQGLSIKKPLIEGGRYPNALMKDIAEFFKKEFPKRFGDLTSKDVIARIQYEHKRKLNRLNPRTNGKEIAEIS